MNEWITILSGGPLAGAAGANTTLYKWLLGSGIIVTALAGLVFFGMLALHVLQQDETAVGVPDEKKDTMEDAASPAQAVVAASEDRQQEEQA